MKPRSSIGAILAAAIPVVFFLGIAPSRATTVDATHSISANYDFTGVPGPYIQAQLAMTINFIANATTGSCAPSLSCFQGDFFNSTNLNFAAVGTGFPAPDFVIGNFGIVISTSDPIGHVIISSIGGSIFNVQSLFISFYTETAVVSGPTFTTFDVIRLNETPLPAALPLFAGGVGLVALLARRRKRKARAA